MAMTCPNRQHRSGDGFAPDVIVELVMSRPAKAVTLCCLAPLTNVALAMAREPRLASHLAGIVLMGGSVWEGGNITAAAEFNFYVDPEAAARVFLSGAAITMIPLDCTHQALLTDQRLEILRSAGTPVGTAFYHLLEWNKRFDRAKYGWAGGPLHDPTVTAYLLSPELFAGRTVRVDIECNSPLTLGASVVDWWAVSGQLGERPGVAQYRRGGLLPVNLRTTAAAMKTISIASAAAPTAEAGSARNSARLPTSAAGIPAAWP